MRGQAGDAVGEVVMLTVEMRRLGGGQGVDVFKELLDADAGLAAGLQRPFVGRDRIVGASKIAGRASCRMLAHFFWLLLLLLLRLLHGETAGLLKETNSPCRRLAAAPDRDRELLISVL